MSRRRVVTLIAVVVLIIALASLRSLAVFWTDSLWFDSIHQGGVFSSLLGVKVGLVAVFGALFFLGLWGNLWLATRFGARDLTFEPEDELVRWYQALVRPIAGRLYAVIALVAGVIAGLGALPQWNSYVLFANAQSFGRRDPLFHKDYGFYVFRLPFFQFLVTWFLVSLVIITLLTTLFHYLNGGIRAARVAPRVSPQVKVHLSVLLALIALVKAIGYVLARYELVTSQNGYVNGASYTDVHARVPALSILFWISLAAAVILLANTGRKGWSLPALSGAMWAFVALVVGVVYPLALQTFKVTPAQSSLELPYIQHNIDATRAAFNIGGVVRHPFAGASTISGSDLAAAADTLSNISLWDPSPNISLETVQRLQTIQSYYTFTTLAVDRYLVNGKVTPVLIGARQLNQDNLPSQSWVNQHLQYTHGYGVAVTPSNTFDPLTGKPNFVVQNVPPVSTSGLPTLTQPQIYFGINDPGWIVGNTKQPEVDYRSPAGVPVESHYAGTGGVQLGGLLQRTAFALRFGDLNLWISNQITANSRILFERDVQAMAAKAAPFLSFDSHPYAVLANGHVDYVLDGYTTTSNYPYSENVTNQSVPGGSGLPYSYNYARNAVKVVIDAYSGAMTMYAFDTKDPILAAYRAAFPSLFQPLSSMPAGIQAHLRYPQDLFAAQAATWGRYHITAPAAFYSSSDRWEVSPTTGSGAPSNGLSQTQVTNSVGATVSLTNSPMDPLYQVMSLPNERRQQLTLSTAFVPFGQSSTVQGLTAFLIATNEPDNYGQLNGYVTPRGTTVTGPVQAASSINQNQRVSPIITQLDQHGSNVLLGHTLMIPLDKSVLYVRPLYVSSTANPLPQLKYVIAVFNSDVGIEPTLSGALSDVLGGNVNTGGGGTSSGGTAASYLAQASAAYNAAQTALKSGNLANYQADITQMGQYLQLAQTALAAGR